MNVIAVESSTLATIAYDRTRELLQLEFSSHAIYQYWACPLRCTKPYCTRLPRATISIGPFGGGSCTAGFATAQERRRSRTLR